MYDSLTDRLVMAFTAADWWMILVISLVVALIMRRWSQWPGATFLAFLVDTISPFFFRVATGVPPDLAGAIAISRLDERGGIVVLLKLGIYFLVIGGMYVLKMRYGRR